MMHPTISIARQPCTATSKAATDPRSATNSNTETGQPSHQQTDQWLAFLGGFGIHPKLSVSTPGDADEREADAVADRVMRMTAPATAPLAVSGFAGSALARACCAGCGSKEDDRRIARKAQAHDVTQMAAQGAAALVASGGQPLGANERAFFEPRFGHDLGGVRIHTGSDAHRAASAIGARAYTSGRHIAFANGQYRPDTDGGRHLLAHELTHTLQQGGPIRRAPPTPGVCDPKNLGTLGPMFHKDESEVKALKLKEAQLRPTADATGVDMNFYCPHRASVAVGALEPQSMAYVIGGGKVRGKHEAWVKVAGQEGYWWGFISTAAYDVPPTIAIPEEEVKAKPKKGRCGPDVTKQLKNGTNNFRTDFAGKTVDQKREMCSQIHSIAHGPVTWDFARLHVRNWMEHEKCATVVSDPAEPCCANSVQVGSECYYAGSANYVLFGAICKSCFDLYAAPGTVDPGEAQKFTTVSMLRLIELYKSDAWNFKLSKDWASAGYGGWPSGGSVPGGDCSSACITDCPEFNIPGAKDNEAFRARLCPHIDPLSACQGWTDNMKDVAKAGAKRAWQKIFD